MDLHRDRIALDPPQPLLGRRPHQPKRHRPDTAVRMTQDEKEVVVEHPLLEADLAVALPLDMQELLPISACDHVGLQGRRQVELRILDTVRADGDVAYQVRQGQAEQREDDLGLGAGGRGSSGRTSAGRH
jgi:hypothetical protein